MELYAQQMRYYHTTLDRNRRRSKTGSKFKNRARSHSRLFDESVRSRYTDNKVEKVFDKRDRVNVYVGVTYPGRSARAITDSIFSTLRLEFPRADARVYGE